MIYKTYSKGASRVGVINALPFQLYISEWRDFKKGFKDDPLPVDDKRTEAVLWERIGGIERDMRRWFEHERIELSSDYEMTMTRCAQAIDEYETGCYEALAEEHPEQWRAYKGIIKEKYGFSLLKKSQIALLTYLAARVLNTATSIYQKKSLYKNNPHLMAVNGMMLMEFYMMFCAHLGFQRRMSDTDKAREAWINQKNQRRDSICGIWEDMKMPKKELATMFKVSVRTIGRDIAEDSRLRELAGKWQFCAKRRKGRSHK